MCIYTAYTYVGQHCDKSTICAIELLRPTFIRVTAHKYSFLFVSRRKGMPLPARRCRAISCTLFFRGSGQNEYLFIPPNLLPWSLITRSPFPFLVFVPPQIGTFSTQNYRVMRISMKSKSYLFKKQYLGKIPLTLPRSGSSWVELVVRCRKSAPIGSNPPILFSFGTQSEVTIKAPAPKGVRLNLVRRYNLDPFHVSSAVNRVFDSLQTTGFHELSRDTHYIKQAHLIISLIKIRVNPLSPSNPTPLSMAPSSINIFAGIEIFKLCGLKYIKIGYT